MPSFQASRTTSKKSTDQSGSDSVRSTVIKVKKGVYQVGKGDNDEPETHPVHQAFTPMGSVISADQTSAEQSGSDVVRQFSVPLSQRHIGGRRLSMYVLALFFIVAASLVISYLSPWGLLGMDKPFEPEVNINFSLLRRFPFTNITLPEDGATVSESTIQITGYIKPGINLYLNNRPIDIDATGFFSTEYILQLGENVFVLEARLGHKRKAATRTVTYDPDLGGVGSDGSPLSTPLSTTDGTKESDRPAEPAGAALRLRLYAWPDDTWYEATTDGVPVERRTLTHGTWVLLEAEDSIRLLVENGDSMVVTLNGRDLGPVSTASGEAEVEYTLDTLANY